MPFTCSICEQESTAICVLCTKDSCDNHLCEKCSRCSDCCTCEVKLDEAPAPIAVHAPETSLNHHQPLSEPEPELPEPPTTGEEPAN